MNNSGDTGETVELEVSKTPPSGVLQSSTRLKSKDSQKGIDDNEEDNLGKRKKNKKTNLVKIVHQIRLHSPYQHSVRCDRVEENCWTLQIKYRRRERNILP